MNKDVLLGKACSTLEIVAGILNRHDEYVLSSKAKELANEIHKLYAEEEN